MRTTPPRPSEALFAEIAEMDEMFERASPLEILTWTLRRFPEDVVVACSFEDVALLRMVWELRPAIEVIFLDTGGHFEETLDFVDFMSAQWDLNLTRTQPGPDALSWPCGTHRCCELRKVEPLTRALSGRAAWITSLKRVDAPSRTHTKILAWDEKFSLVKVNPLATWDDDDVAYYIRSRALPEHPLWSQGYASIGCAAVTNKPSVAGDRRSGRWAGLEREECGLHEG